MWRICLSLVAFVLLTACGGGGGSVGGGQLDANATLQNLIVSVSSTSIASGTQATAIATGSWTDGTSRLLPSSSVAWSSSNPAVATIDSNGTITSLAQGNTYITGSIDGISNSTSLSVTNAVLQSIDVQTGSAGSLPAGLSTQMTAQGNFTDGTSQDISNSIQWSSSNPLIATIDSQGNVKAISAGNSTISATQNGVTTHFVITVSSATITALAISPNGTTLTLGIDTQLSASATYSDGTTRDVTNNTSWSATGSGTVTNVGKLQPTRSGSIQVTASFSGKTSVASFSVPAATVTLLSIQVTPVNSTMAKGTSQYFQATGIYSNGSTSSISSDRVIWSSSNTAVVASAGYSGSNIHYAVGVGTAEITATLGAVSGKTSVTVTPALLKAISISPSSPQIAKGNTQQFIATGTYSDNTTQNISSQVIWQTGNSVIGTVSPSGLAKGEGTGKTSIKATLGAISATATLEVSAAIVKSVQIRLVGSSTDITNTNTTNIPKGLAQNLEAYGTYSDGTVARLSGLFWTSEKTSVATIDNSGLLTAKNTGTAKINVAMSSCQTCIVASTYISVIPASLKIINVLVDSNIGINQSRRITATGEYTDGVTRALTDIEWTSSDTNKLIIDSSGMATGIKPGLATIQAKIGSIVGTSQIRISPLEIVYSLGGQKMAIDGNDNIYVVTDSPSSSSSSVLKIQGNTKNIVYTTTYGNVIALTLFGNDLFVVDKGLKKIIKVSSDGNLSDFYIFPSTEPSHVSNAGAYSLLIDSLSKFYTTAYHGGKYGRGFAAGYSFSGLGNDAYCDPPIGNEILNDGRFVSPGLVIDGAGNLYGTTREGEGVCAYRSSLGYSTVSGSFGTVFKISPSGVKTTLLKFRGSGVGVYPEAGLTIDAAGNLYGTTCGDKNSDGKYSGGSVFDMSPTPPYSARMLHDFSANPLDGKCPKGKLLRDRFGNIYGTTYAGGEKGLGTVFKIDASSGKESVIHSFGSSPTDGVNPGVGLVMDSNGVLYGIAGGGEFGSGIFFKIVPWGE